MRILLTFLLSACLALTGCSTSRLVPLSERPADGRPAVRVGERLHITLKSGEELDLKVTETATGTVTGTRISPPKGGTVQVSMTEVQSITAKQFSGWRTTGLVLGVVGAAFIALLAMVVASLDCDDDDDCD